MIETLPAKASFSEVEVPASVLEGFTAFRRNLIGRSLVVWGEHCSECAYPDCYSRCSFYTPRPDLHCRRFENGIERLRDYPDLHHVRFRRWGKLEGRGPSPAVAVADAISAERRDARVSGLIEAAAAPFQVKRHAAWRWNRRKGLSGLTARVPSPDRFVIETWAADGRVHGFTLTILNPRTTARGEQRLFQTQFEASPHYGRLTVPIDAIQAHVRLDEAFLIQIEPVGDANGVSVVFGLCDFAIVDHDVEDQHPTQLRSGEDRGGVELAPVKVVVWDLDDTLWTGVLAETGIDGVELRPAALSAIRFLDERGVLQCIASKNDAREAGEALEALGLSDYFLYPQIHWGPKSASIEAQAQALELSLESFVFIDDQPFERAEVVKAHPMVRVLDGNALGDLTDHPWFNLPATAESRRRRSLYRSKASREAAFSGGAGGDDYLAFLRSAGLKLEVRAFSADDVERAFELSQRTNQLNFTGSKWSREALFELLERREGRFGVTLRCRDEFGDYGLIGFLIFEPGLSAVKELFLSCRIQRKRVEHALFSWLSGVACSLGVPSLSVFHRPTSRNQAATIMLEGLGFEASADQPARWIRRAEIGFEDADIVAVDGAAVDFAVLGAHQ